MMTNQMQYSFPEEFLEVLMDSESELEHDADTLGHEDSLEVVNRDGPCHTLVQSQGKDRGSKIGVRGRSGRKRARGVTATWGRNFCGTEQQRDTSESLETNVGDQSTSHQRVSLDHRRASRDDGMVASFNHDLMSSEDSELDELAECGGESHSSVSSAPPRGTPGDTLRINGPEDRVLHPTQGSSSQVDISTPLKKPMSSRKVMRPSRSVRDSHQTPGPGPRPCADDEEDDDMDEEEEEIHYGILRNATNRLRQEIIEREESNMTENVKTESEERVDVSNVLEENMNVEAPESVSTVFRWTDDWSSFTGHKETYLRQSGPTFNSQDPCEIFIKIWDEDIMHLIAEETNTYARSYLSQYSNPNISATSPKYLEKWQDITIEVLYKYFALLIYMSMCQRAKLQEYWDTEFLEMPKFRQLFTRDGFLLLTKFLHFVSDRDTPSTGYARHVSKVAPLLDHCNRKFSELYIPEQHICLDESLLLWKGRLNWRQCIRTKAARFGIKSFELCEATTGYLFKSKLDAGKGTPVHPEPLHGFTNPNAKAVLELMEGYFDVGHVLVIDDWYNQLPLTRYLKKRKTDVLGTISRCRKDVPKDIKDLQQDRVARGEWVARHCGNVAVVAWKDVKILTVLSTYLDHEMAPRRRPREPGDKPNSVSDYNKYMGGVDLKDQKLSYFTFERKRNRKWYMKVFKRLFNTSLLNAYIIYTRNSDRMYTHREFRRKVAKGLLGRFCCDVQAPLPALRPMYNSVAPLRLLPGDHFPVYTELAATKSASKHRRLDCVRCRELKKRSQVTLMCKMCRAPLCVGKCWSDYHTLDDLKSTSRCSDKESEFDG